MPAWPSTLPGAAEIEGYSERPTDLAIRTPMDVGPAKVRRRYTAGVTAIEGTMLMSAAQTVTLMAFWRDTTAAGSLSFDWTHPRTGEVARVRFTVPPELRPEDAGALWRASLRMEILP
ncbi:hypothetical protein [Elioraea sp.]|uniref:hypothetical protein n=1 Tax=Elioraea sp. TaxID=2185103 RepID=UPI0025C41D80|nr:hypothetical protein [Elioraea sp.]